MTSKTPSLRRLKSTPKKGTVSDLSKLLRHHEWKLANRKHIAAYNALVEREGVFSDGLRPF